MDYMVVNLDKSESTTCQKGPADAETFEKKTIVGQ